MAKRKINLEEIYNRYEYLARVETDSTRIDYKGNMLKAMKEACERILELAAENADMDLQKVKHPRGDGYHYHHVIDKQSILDTINQIK
jgi:hypothetical protein